MTALARAARYTTGFVWAGVLAGCAAAGYVAAIFAARRQETP